ncbi:MAG: FGGY-family carbohydrate kinase [Clostridium sp.]|nr:FGGY-family carbohydrate kinase [Clostridium sp.]MDY5895468.1 FGGY-family carbohydrate kinase [Oscillospiraceae bacterium]
MENVKNIILNAETALGIEFGSTRIKSVLVDLNGSPLASGSFDWENSYKNGVWTYSLDEVFEGLRASFAALKKSVYDKYGVKLETVGSMGISGMMHGYLAFDKDGAQLAEFRTWRNTITAEAAEKLSALFDFNIPQRWSIAHLYQAILNGEEHVGRVDFIATLAAYVHYRLTGERVIGVGEASGMFPIDSSINDYDAAMLDKFDGCVADKGFPWKIRDILPRVLVAGERAGTLTAEGAAMLDPTGEFRPGVPMCPPEGDAGTGMVATNSVAVRTGNVSAGTSIFLMVVLEKALSKLYPEIDMVTTPSGKPVAMVHCNNCSGEIDAWAGLFTSMCSALGMDISIYKVLDKMFESALSGDKDCGGLVAFNYLSGEVITGLDSGKPLFLRGPESKFNLPNFARAQLCSAAATLSIGMEILADEHVKIDKLLGHGGYFKAPLAGQKIMAAALEAPVSVMKTAGEGGPWGIALLASYMQNKAEGETLEAFLDSRVFSNEDAFEVKPDPEDIAGFKKFLDNYKKSLPVEKAAVEAF